MKPGTIIGIVLLLVVAIFTTIAFQQGPSFDAEVTATPLEGEVTATPLEGEVTFDDLLDAIRFVESKGDPNAICPDSCCVGAYGITKLYVDDCNRIMVQKKLMPIAFIGDIFNYEDRWDSNTSRVMVELYTIYYASKAWDEIWDSGEFETINEQEGFMKYFELQARIHNGGPNGWKKESTKPYWEKVKKAWGRRFLRVEIEK